MALSINSNISSLLAQRSLAEDGNELSRVYQQLSSGQRINQASDDAAGLAISESLKSTSRVFTQAVRNLNDGISLLSVTQGALSSLRDITIRQQELAEEAANGSYSSKQRLALNTEANALVSEFNRIVQSTTFNGVHVLDTSQQSGAVQIQAGYGSANTLSVDTSKSLARTVGTGSFQSAATVSGIDYITRTGDLNGDGVDDLVAITGASANIAISIVSGDGTIRTTQTLTSTNSAGDVAIGDLNGDGFADLAVADATNNVITTFINNGDGQFHAGASFYAYSAGQIAIGDINGDGKGDIGFIDHLDGALVTEVNQGNGTYTQASSTVVASFYARSFTSGDFNGDGRTDFLVNVWQNPYSVVFLGQADGTVKAVQTLTTTTGTNAVPGAATGDFDGDGILDVVLASEGGNSVQVLYGKGDGTFNAGASYAVGTTGQSYDVRVGDIDNDGRLDIAVFNTVTGVNVFHNNGNTAAGTATFSDVATAAANYFNFNLLDVNGDGVLDLITTDSTGGQSTKIAYASTSKSDLVLGLDLKTQASARSSIPLLQAQLDRVEKELGTIGASQSRFQVATAQLSSANIQFQEANSRIVDGDVAAETAQLTRLQILQQAGASVLAQANQQPSLALKLLQG